MATAREVAIEVLPYFEQSVLAGHVLPYRYYASSIGRDAAKESMVIGQAMHAIGGVCALCAIPIAPLFFIKRSDDEWRGIFEGNPSEQQYVLPHYDLLYVTAREYKYTAKDFQRLSHGLKEVLPKHLGPDQLSQHDIWRVVIHSKLQDGTTPLDRAILKYKEIYAEAQKTKRGE
jgi:hypothetical protein